MMLSLKHDFSCVCVGVGLKWKRKVKRKHDVYTCVEEDQNVERITSPLGCYKPCGSFLLHMIPSKLIMAWQLDKCKRTVIFFIMIFTNVSFKYAINVWTSFFKLLRSLIIMNMFTFIFHWFCVTNVTTLTWWGICIHTYIQVSKTGQYTCKFVVQAPNDLKIVKYCWY